MRGFGAGRGAGALGTRHAGDRAIEERRDARLHEEPGAHVPGLLLHPAELCLLGVRRNDLLKELGRERVELLEPDDRHVGDLRGLARLQEVVVDLPSAEQELPSLLAFDLLGDLRDDPLEGARRQILHGGGRAPMPQQALGGHHDEGLAIRADDLPAERVEDLRGGGRVDHLQVVFGAHRQEALEARAGVLWALALEAVRQEQGQAAEAMPFVL